MGEATRKMALKAQSDSSAPADVKAMEVSLARAVAECLIRDFPGYAWGVFVDFAQGIATIKLPYLMRASHCFCLHLDSVDTWPAMQRAVRRAGGELLERFRLSRAGFEFANFHEARKLTLVGHGQPMPE